MARAWSSFRIMDLMGKPKFISCVDLIPSYSSDDDRHLSIFEVYPQSEIPLITLIANVQYASDEEYPLHLLSDTLISCSNVRVLSEDRIIFRIWNYRTNYATCFSVSVDLGPIHVFFVLLKDVEVSF